MSAPNSKLTRRRGACEACRHRKGRCDGAKPCNYCQRTESTCEYNIRPLRRRVQETSVQTPKNNALATAQLYATHNEAMSHPLDEDHHSNVAVCQVGATRDDLLTTPFSEDCFSQFVVETPNSYPDLGFLNELILGDSEAMHIETSQQIHSVQSQTTSYTPSERTSTPKWLEAGCEQNQRQHSVTPPHDFLETREDNGVAQCNVTLLSERISAHKAGVKPFLNHRIYGITALFENADRGSRRKQAVLAKIEALLSTGHQTCIPDLLRKADPGKEQQGLDLNSLPIRRLIQQAFGEIGGLSLFIQEQHITRISEWLLDTGRPPIDVTDVSLLMTSLAWGALLDSEVGLASKAALLDAMLETSTLLQRQNSSIRQFMALVAALCLAEKIGSENLPELLLCSVTTVASLSLHLRSALRSSCVSDKQAAQTMRAMWMLYCIDKSYALRWQTFSLLGDGSLPTMSMPDNTLQDNTLTTSSLQWLWGRFQYSKITSKILQLRVSAEAELARDHINRTIELSTELEGWYRGVVASLVTMSLDNRDTMRVQLQMSCYYHEARLQLASIGLSEPESSFPAGWNECKEQLKSSIREIFISSNPISSEQILQNQHCLFLNTLALCLLVVCTLLELDQDCLKENQALISIVAGFFARIGIELAQNSIFREVSSLIEMLTYC